MATMISEVYLALLDAGASEEKARAAAETLAGYESRFAGIELRLTVLQLMVGGLYAVGLPLAWLVERIAAKVGVLGA